jgi:enamine deaminase RidA (YjgF/YER057c/UK114 family)
MTKTIIKPAGVGARRRTLQSWSAPRRSAVLRGANCPVPETGQLLAGDIKAQTERVLENIKLILQDQGLTTPMSSKPPFSWLTWPTLPT